MNTGVWRESRGLRKKSLSRQTPGNLGRAPFDWDEVLLDVAAGLCLITLGGLAFFAAHKVWVWSW